MIDHQKKPEERWTFSSASGNLLYTYENLSEKDFLFFKELDIQGIYQKEGYPVFRYCHGSPTSSRELLLPENKNLGSVIGQRSYAYSEERKIWK